MINWFVVAANDEHSWSIDFFVEDDGTLPVRDWLDQLPDEVRAKVIARIDLLKESGPALDFP